MNTNLSRFQYRQSPDGFSHVARFENINQTEKVSQGFDSCARYSNECINGIMTCAKSSHREMDTLFQKMDRDNFTPNDVLTFNAKNMAYDGQIQRYANAGEKVLSSYNQVVDVAYNADDKQIQITKEKISTMGSMIEIVQKQEDARVNNRISLNKAAFEIKAGEHALSISGRQQTLREFAVREEIKLKASKQEHEQEKAERMADLAETIEDNASQLAEKKERNSYDYNMTKQRGDQQVAEQKIRADKMVALDSNAIAREKNRGDQQNQALSLLGGSMKLLSSQSGIQKKIDQPALSSGNTMVNTSSVTSKKIELRSENRPSVAKKTITIVQKPAATNSKATVGGQNTQNKTDHTVTSYIAEAIPKAIARNLNNVPFVGPELSEGFRISPYPSAITDFVNEKIPSIGKFIGETGEATGRSMEKTGESMLIHAEATKYFGPSLFSSDF